MLFDLLNKSVLMEGEPGAGGGGEVSQAVKDFVTTTVKDVVNTTVNGALKNFATKDLGKLLSESESVKGLGTKLDTLLAALNEEEPVGGEPDSAKKEKGAELPAEVNARFKRLEDSLKAATDQLGAERKARETAEASAKQTRKDSALRTELGQFNFANKETLEDTVALLTGHAEFDDSGNLVAGGLPLADYVKDFVGKRPNLLGPVKTGGSGASQGAPRQGAGTFDMDQIKPGAKPEVFAQAAKEIRQVLQAQQ